MNEIIVRTNKQINKKRNFHKKSQITAFIIIGVLLLFTVAIVSYVKQIGEPGKEKEKVYEISTNAEPVRSYVEYCLKEIGKKAVKEVALHGGKINLKDNLNKLDNPTKLDNVDNLNSPNNLNNPNYQSEVQYLNGTKISYLCLYEQNKGCVNQILSREDMEREISEDVKLKLKECIDLDIFRNQGFSVKEGGIDEIKTETKISDNEVSLTLKYSLKLTKEKLELDINTYGTKINVPLGILFKTSINILNSELQELNFDSVGFMKEHGNILIEKFKPYPDIIYRLTVKDSLTLKNPTVLNDDLVFQFAIQGKDTVSEVGYSVYGVNENNPPANNNGCCYNPVDNFCYKNSVKKECEKKQGIYSTSNTLDECRCNLIEISPKIGLNPLEICKNTYNRAENNFKGGDRINGESWCSSESETSSETYSVSETPKELAEDKKFASELVGSREYVHYCIEGKEYVEPCRDYREEICVDKEEKDVLGKNYKKAKCRPNRWQDCIECETQECCEDSVVRDCAWESEMSTDKKCVPAIAPGFKFWEVSAITSCTRANQKKECSGISCSQEWVDDTAKLCYMQGDCGNYRNVKNVLTGYGFLNTDLKYKPQKKIYDIEKDINNSSNGNNLLFDAPEMALTATYKIGEAIDANAELLSAGLNYLNEITAISFSDFINPFKGKPIIHVLDISLCSIWQAPRLNQDCGYCTKNSFTPCTEYLCKSLGQQCLFDYNYGSPICKREKADDKTPPKISIDKEALFGKETLPNKKTFPKGDEANKYEAYEILLTAGSMDIKGYKIMPELLPHTSFTIGIKADEKVTCKLALMPFKKFNELKGIYFGQQTFSETQNITLRVPPNVAIPQNMLDILNYSHYEQISEFLEEPEYVANNYQEKYKTPIMLYNTFSGEDITKKISPVTEMIKNFIERYKKELPNVRALINLSLSKFENNTYMLFVQCMDEAGNENTEPMFIEFSIKNNKNKSIDDKNAPLIVGAVPENNSLISNDVNKQKISIYLDEPGECKYDYVNYDYKNNEDKSFAEMEYSFECSGNEYKLSPAFGGTYECSTTLPTQSTMSTLNEETQIYIKCKDNPFGVKEYYFYAESAEIGKENKIYNEFDAEKNSNNELAQNNFFNFTEPNKIYSSLSMFEDKHLLYVVNSSNSSEIELHLFKDTPDSCTYTINSDNKDNNKYPQQVQQGELTFCMRTDNIALGTYECIESIKLNFTNAENTEEMKNLKNDGAEKKIYEKIYNISFKCPTTQVMQQNVNEESYVYVLKKSEPLKITETLPKGEVKINNPKLAVKTTPSKDVICRYKKEFALSYMNMIKVVKWDEEESKVENEFVAQLHDLPQNTNTFIVKCIDDYGNSDEEKIEFYVIN
ncbi:hypothetical protein HY636_00175 [Candidatus Woesearchaeota archaeon]|nr:hypothetical protein [Candidatus Woesearchaeota archaeon]